MSGQLETDLAFVRRLARASGAQAAAFYARAQGVDRKTGGEPVTRVDRELNARIVEALGKRFPDQGIVAEESRLSREPRPERFWLVDPIDGTREMIAGTGQFAVHIAQVVEGTPRLGVVFQVASHRLFYAAEGLGAWVEAGGRRVALAVSDERDPAGARLAVSRAHRSKRVQAFVERLGLRRQVPAGGVGIKTCLVAAGRCDLYLHPSAATSQWDTAAPDVVLREAGGRITDLTGAPLDYTSPDPPLRRGIAASNGLLHEAVLDRLRPLVDAWLAS